MISILPAADWRPGAHCVEWLVEDGSDEPWSCHLSPGQIDRAPGPDDVGKPWIATVWDEKKGRPHKCLERVAYFQIVPTLPVAAAHRTAPMTPARPKRKKQARGWPAAQRTRLHYQMSHPAQHR